MAIPQSTSSAPLNSSWPPDITRDTKRCIKILVKNQESISGAEEELKAAIEERWEQYKQMYEEVSQNGTLASDSEKQKDFKNKSKKLTKAKTVYGIALPLPNELSDNQSHKWETSEGAVASIASGLADSISKIGGTRVPEGMKNLFSSFGGAQTMSRSLGQITSATGIRKPIVDPGYFQDYKGSDPRTFTFSWDLIPANASEADTIMTILYNLKKFTLPKSIGGLALLSPYMFDIIIGNDRISAVVNMNNVICTNMNVNYAADGGLQFLPDGVPKYIKLEMTFAERSLVTSEFY